MLLSNTVSALKMQNTSLRSALPIKSNGSLLSGSSQFWHSEQCTADIKHCELQREREYTKVDCNLLCMAQNETRRAETCDLVNCSFSVPHD